MLMHALQTILCRSKYWTRLLVVDLFLTKLLGWDASHTPAI
jgi:hypothetical protein